VVVFEYNFVVAVVVLEIVVGAVEIF